MVLDRGNHSAVERGAKSLADDLGMDRGVVPSRAAASLRSAETNPSDPRDLSAISRRTNSRYLALRLDSCSLPLMWQRPCGNFTWKIAQAIHAGK